uniref:EamA family transporter n=1 Tax=Gordoniibacillus kamchatkensis TaxID=1590651 RepID=UPI00373AE222
MVFTNIYILSGIIMSVITTLSWMATLAKVPLSFAYPFISLALPLVLIFSSLLFGDHVSLARWCGVFLIIIGLIVVVNS